jgi:hypothetical protein
MTGITMTVNPVPTPAFAYVTAQEEIITNIPIDKELKSIVKLTCFPSYPNSSWPREQNYNGLKIFPAMNNLCISYFFNEGKKDRFGRPILSSKVIIIPKQLLGFQHREISAYINFLKKINIHTVTIEALEDFLHKNTVTTDRQSLNGFLDSQSISFVAKSISCLMSNDRVNIFYRNEDELNRWLSAAYLFLPPSTLLNKVFVSDCEGLNQENRENFVAIPKVEKESLLQPITKMFEKKPKDLEIIDIEKHKADGNKYGDLMEGVISEICSEKEWYSINWEERNKLLIAFLNKAVLAEEKASLHEISEKISAMTKTLERVRSLERLVEK